MDFNKKLIKVFTLDDITRSFPSPRIWSRLILNKDFISRFEGSQLFGVSRPGFVLGNMPFGQGSLSVMENLFPSVVRVIMTRGNS